MRGARRNKINRSKKRVMRILLLIFLILTAKFFLIDGRILTATDRNIRYDATTYLASASLFQTEPEIEGEEDSTFELRRIKPETIEGNMPKVGKYIGVDLTRMQLFLFNDGLKVDTYEILSKGRPGTPWETPSGMYGVLSKNVDHFSSMGSVHLPYSMQFYGNFFIHGWPYYPDKTPVHKGYSGGCIRLSTEDSKKVFEFAKIGTPIFVYDNPSSIDSTPTVITREIPIPSLSSRSYLVASLDTGEVFLDYQPERKLPIASITKLMTAVVANESIAWFRNIPIIPKMLEVEGYKNNIRVGDKWNVEDILYPLIMESDNHAAHAISTFYGQKAFIDLMDKKARSLGMGDTKFADSSGLLPGNVSTANDLFQLARYIHDKKHFLLEISRTTTVRITSSTNGKIYQFNNNNPFRGRKEFVGGKNGFTDEAKRTLVSIFNVPVGNISQNVVIIVLGSDNHTEDTVRLLNWLTESTRSF
jgi:serine-type D-Ala-D-Ala endopeptidase (penicillin-binding protein 7)